MLYFRILSQDMNCVAAIGVVHFSVRGFDCALFYFRKEYENMKAKKFLAVATAVALLISLTACAGTGNEQASSADKSTSDITDSVPSSVDESSDTVTQSKEETTVSTESTTEATTSAASKEETTVNTESTTAATTPAASVEESTDTVTESKAETTVGTVGTTAEIPATEAPVTTKAETIAPTLSKNERYVYDEDGNVVDKIKVKVVDGVTYTVGEKSDDKCILDGVPLLTNDPEFPSGNVITMMQIVLYNSGITISQKDIFEKYIEYHTPDEWYEENGIKYGPEITKLLQDPRLEPSKFENKGIGAVEKYCKKFFEEQGKRVYDLVVYDFRDETHFKEVKNLLLNEKLPLIQTTQPSDLVWEWMAKDLAGIEVQQGVFGGWESSVVIGYTGEKLITYDVSNGKIKYNEKKIIDVRSLEPRDAVE